MKRLFYTIVAVLLALPLFAEVEFSVSAPQTVEAGKPFQVVYLLNESGSDLRLPSLPSGLEVIAGPYTSTSSSTQWINGKITSSKEVRYTYTFLASKEGTYTIPAASIKVDKERYSSKAVQIKVLPEDQSSSQQQGQSQSQGGASSQNITADNLFIRAIASRTTVCEQEAIALTYRVYARVDLVNINNVKFPDFAGFLVQEVDLPQNRQLSQEHYNGKNYNVYDLRKVILFPQRSGQINIEPVTCDLIVRLRRQAQSRGFFDSFFDTYQDVSKTTSSPSVKINVSPLPSPKPTDFCGMVGSLRVNSSASTTSVKAHEPITIEVKFDGEGNLKMLKEPAFNFPKDFETYEPKITNNFTPTANGLQGSKTIEYLVIPRHDGDFHIPSVNLSYYDTNAKRYSTIEVQGFDIHVDKGEDNGQSAQIVSSFADQERVEKLASDIRYITSGKLNLRPSRDTFVGTLFFYLAYLLPLLITILLIIIFRKQARDNANVALMRNKKANKVASKRLKSANKYLLAGQSGEFYEEILRAMWGYLADKLSIDVADLNRDNISAELAKHAVKEEVIEQFMSLLDSCQFARYAPKADAEGQMESIYNKTVKIISSIENQIKK